MIGIYMIKNMINGKCYIGQSVALKVSKKLKGKYVGENNSFYGKKHSKETKDKMLLNTKMKIIKFNNLLLTHTKEEVKKILGISETSFKRYSSDEYQNRLYL